MDPEIDNLDLDLSKKKKKAKKPIDLDALDAESPSDLKADQVGDDELEDLGDLLSKKKKKKKKAFNLDDLEGALPETDAARDASGDIEVSADADASVETDLTLGDGDLDFNLPLKKKKKKKVTLVDAEPVDDYAISSALNDIDEDGLDKENVSLIEPIQGLSAPSYAWANTDRDYTYDELLDLVFNIIKEKNPDIVAGEKRRLVMRPPQVLRVGTKKSSFANFIDICKS
jgi:translation initiation factor 2 subunit 2